MNRTRRALLSLVGISLLMQASPAAAAGSEIPEWVRPAVNYLSDKGWLDKASFSANEPMTRAAFTTLIKNVFGGGYSRTRGLVRGAEVSAALVDLLGKSPVADDLEQVSSPDGWHPRLGRWFGTEIVAREMGLRYNRIESEDDMETSAGEAMKQADVVYAVWKAKTSPSTSNADAVSSFGLASYSEKRRSVVEFALSLVGTPYVWGGDWKTATPAGYPYGAQAAGGFDCSGFAWYVLKEKSSGFSPTGRDYEGWAFPERSTTEIARATEKKISYANLLPGDMVFFAPGGRDASASDVYHAGIYLGRGWMVHSSSSRAGISLAQIGPGSYWNDQLTWGRRIITR